MLDTTRRSREKTVRVALIDAHPIIRAGLTSVLVEENGLELVTESRTVDEAIAGMKANEVEVAILGVREPLNQAVTDLEQLRDQCPEVAPIVFTSLQSAPYVSRMLIAGARAYLLTEYSREEVIDAVKTAHRGRTIKAPAELILGAIRGMPMTCPDEGDSKSSYNRLTTRENEILNFMATGVSYRTIAETLFLAESTVKKYAHTVITKLGATNRATAVLNAHRLNLLSEQNVAEQPPPA